MLNRRVMLVLMGSFLTVPPVRADQTSEADNAPGDTPHIRGRGGSEN